MFAARPTSGPLPYNEAFYCSSKNSTSRSSSNRIPSVKKYMLLSRTLPRADSRRFAPPPLLSPSLPPSPLLPRLLLSSSRSLSLCNIFAPPPARSFRILSSPWLLSAAQSPAPAARVSNISHFAPLHPSIPSFSPSCFPAVRLDLVHYTWEAPAP